VTQSIDWIDVSVPLHNGMVHWPGDPPYRMHHVMDQRKGDICTVSQVTMGVHTGTHMDAPLHFIEDAASIDKMPFDATVGRARVVEIRDPKCIHRDELEPLAIESDERILFKTANSNRQWHKDPFNEDFVFIEQSGARYLAERGVRLVGVDYLSVGGFKQDAVETHHALLDAGIWVIEGLDLSGIEPGTYEMICLPLKLVDSDGSPARAILRSLK
jgi:arylformamidase